MSSKPVEASEGGALVPATDEVKDVPKGTQDRRKHKGKGAKANQAERFRVKKNEQTYNDRMTANRALRDSFCSDIEGMDVALKAMAVGASFQKPPAEVAVKYTGISELAEATVEHMSDCKIQPEEGHVDRENDRRLIETVTKLQVYAKCAFARAQGPFERDTASHELVSLVNSQLSVGLKSSAAYLENIGSVEVSGQAIYPLLPENPAADQIPEGWIRTSHVFGEGRLYVDLRGVEPAPNVDSVAILGLPDVRKRFIQGELVDLDATVKSYSRMLARVAKKMPGAITRIDLESGKGTCAQLVGSRDVPHRVGYMRERRAWSYRELPQSAMLIGAGFGYGLDSADPWHAETMAVVLSGDMKPGSFMTKVVQVNGKVPGADAR